MSLSLNVICANFWIEDKYRFVFIRYLLVIAGNFSFVHNIIYNTSLANTKTICSENRFIQLTRIVLPNIILRLN
ncbi:unnamed protein product [Heterobilharzia americana]|nr:unnamed protein product [Heterobilharzia americana]